MWRIPHAEPIFNLTFALLLAVIMVTMLIPDQRHSEKRRKRLEVAERMIHILLLLLLGLSDFPGVLPERAYALVVQFGIPVVGTHV